MRQYFIYNGLTQEGPFSADELKTKKLAKDTPVWYDGLDAWTTAGAVDELKTLFEPVPPPFATNKRTNAEPAQIRSDKAHKSNKSSVSLTRKLLILAGVVIFILAGIFINNLIEQQQYQERLNAEADIKAQIRNNITSYVTAERSAYNYSTLGGISNLSISVTNSTDYLIDNVKVRVIYIKANGDVWDSRYLNFNLLDPHTKSTIDVADTYRGTSVEYEIVSIKSSVLGLD